MATTSRRNISRMRAKSIRMIFRNFSLIHDKAYVNGDWVTGEKCQILDVMNPANEEVIGGVPNMNVNDVNRAIKAAYKAFPKWSSFTAKKRSVLLRNWYNEIQKHKEELSRILTLETGKPLSESRAELDYGNSFVDWFAEEARRIYGEVVPSPMECNEIMFLKQPIGVVGLITPWNFPCAMVTRKAAAALAAGCTCVLKPAEDTPFTALALCGLASQADIPDGVVNVVTCDRENAKSIGKRLCDSPLIAGISFTGSTTVGRLLYQYCATGIKRVSLELGGNAPFVVFETADMKKAVDGAIAAKFRNNGQTCISANRILVKDCIFDEFVEEMKEKMLCLKMGDGMEPDTDLGPIINCAQLEKLEKIVKDAVDKGAKVLCGGKRATDVGNLFFPPTILTDITSDMLCYTEEIFGPIVVFIKFETEDEAMQICNDTKTGLAGYFYSNNISQIWRVAKKMQVGMVGINSSKLSVAEAAFGGVKESGIGREGSRYGIDGFINIKYLTFGNE